MLNNGLRGVAFAMLISILSGGCTARDLYGAGQDYQRQQCRSGAPSDYERCMQRANESFETYERKKKELEESQ